MKEHNEEITTPEAVLSTPTATQSTSIAPASNSKAIMWFAIAGVTILIGVIGVVVGMQLNKSNSTTVSQQNGFGANGQMGRGGPDGNGRGMGALGTVTAISSGSITVKDQMNSTDVTFTISSSTTVSDDSGSVSAISGIKVGDKVLVRTGSTTTSSTSSSAATAIVVNPQMPSGGPGGTASTTN